MCGFHSEYITLYHGSTALFGRVDLDGVETPHACIFFASDYDYAKGFARDKGIVYATQLKFEREKWLMHGDAALPEMVADVKKYVADNRVAFEPYQTARHIDAFLNKPLQDVGAHDLFPFFVGKNNGLTDTLRNKYNLTGFYVCGVYGFFSKQDVPPTKIFAVIGNFPEAYAAFLSQAQELARFKL